MTIISTSVDGTGAAYVFSADDLVCIINPNVDVISTTDSAIYTFNSQDIVENFGNIISTNSALGDFGSPNSNVFINESTGTMATTTGINSYGDHDYLVNYGHITAELCGMFTVGSDVNAINSGSINAGDEGIWGFGVANFTLANSGDISSTGDGLVFTSTLSGTDTVNNSGSISGTGAAIDSSGASGFVLRNSGNITGDIFLDDALDTVANSGTINGDVTMKGNDVLNFDGRGGAVNGDITGGTGADVIRPGKGDTTINGGGGHDILYAGGGDATFVVDSSAVANTFEIMGFNVARDTIDFVQSDFAQLTAGAAPPFSIGAPTSASGHIFYNSGSGWLKYDSDGNGPAASVKIAYLGPGLQLTASNFEVT